MRQFECKDAGFDCDAVVTADSDEEVLAQVGSHAREAHGVEVTPELRQQLAGRVHEVA